MASRKAKGDAGEAAWQGFRDTDGWVTFPLSPSFEGADLLAFGPEGQVEIAEVKAWNRPIDPATRAQVITRLVSLQRQMSKLRRFRVSVVLIHAVRGDDGEWRFAETWRFP